MPIEIARVERGLYLNRWLGVVTLDDVAGAAQTGRALMQTHDEAQVVLVNDLAAAERLPGDVRVLRRLAADNPQVIALLVVSAPSLVRVMAEAQAAGAPWQVGFFDSIDAACAHGRGLLAAGSTKAGSLPSPPGPLSRKAGEGEQDEA